MDYSNRSHDTELLAFRRSKNRLVDSQCIESKLFENSNDAMITIKLTILDLDLKLQMALFGCIFPGGVVSGGFINALPALFTEFSPSFLGSSLSLIGYQFGQKGAWMLRCVLQTADLSRPFLNLSRPKVDFGTDGISMIFC